MRRLLPLSLASLVLLILLLALVGPARLGAEVDLNLGSVELARATAALGDAEQERQHAAAAAFYLGRAAEREPGDPRVLRGLAAALAGTDREGARRALERAAEVTAPDDSRSFFQIGRLYREIREVDAALAAWEHVDPSLNVWNGAGLDYQLVSWGTSLALVGRWRDAIAVNQAAIRAAPTNPAPWATLGVALARELGPRGALPTLESLVESYPDVPWAYREVQSARRRAGQWQEDALWRGRVAAASGSAAWARRQADAASARQYHLRWRGHIPSGRSSRPPKTPTIDDGMSQDGGARLITNTTDRLRSYVTEVEFKRGETVVAAARGTAEHVRPGERRAIRFSPPPPSLESSGIVAVFRTVTEESEAGQLAEAATRLRLAGWRDLSDVGLEVVVRNDDRAAHSFVVQAMLGEDGRFLRLLSGTVAELGPGQQAAVTLLAPRRLPSYNQVLLGIERILD